MKIINKITKDWAVACACWTILLLTGFFAHHLSTVDKVYIKKPFQEFPYRVGGDWIGKGLPGSDYLAGALGADEYFLRNYHDDFGNNVELYFAYFEYIAAKKGPHAPQLCWIGSGWVFKDMGDDIIILRSEKMPLVSVKKILAEREGKKVLLFYCYKLNDRYFTDFGTYRIAAVIDTIFKRRNNAFTLQLTTAIEGEDHTKKESMMKDFLSKALTILENDFLP
jgi:EpsI family protein